MTNISRATSFPRGISLNDDVGIFPLDVDPSQAPGFEAPQGSKILQTNGKMWRKVGVAATDWNEMDVTIFQAQAGRPNVSTDTYLDNAFERPSNLVGFVVPYNMTLLAMAAAAQAAGTWTAEVHVGEVLVPGASLAVTAAKTAFAAGYNVQFTAGDELQFFCNGTSINRPTVSIFMRLD